ncbi:hypothetical protein V1477_010734 [Vespula maculifrons]|uniref:Uncharacterized protein n=1 Tax=Vespula maculifrons TaxID=7453 RepID=A0ABD2C3B9_VESMC
MGVTTMDDERSEPRTILTKLRTHTPSMIFHIIKNDNLIKQLSIMERSRTRRPVDLEPPMFHFETRLGEKRTEFIVGPMRRCLGGPAGSEKESMWN